MRVAGIAAGELPSDLAAIGVPVRSGTEGPALAVPPDLATGVPAELDHAWCRRHRFEGKAGQTAFLRSGYASGDPEIVLVGVGGLEDPEGDRSIESVRRAAAAFVRAVGRAEQAALLIPVDSRGHDATVLTAGAAAEGAVLGSYGFEEFRTGEDPGRLDSLLVVGAEEQRAAIDAGLRRGSRVAESVNFARDLVNEPPSSLTPERFAERIAERLEGAPGVSVEVWDEDRIRRERLGGLLGVARGSVQPPRLVSATYEPGEPVDADGPVPHVALVGKGITFDSGGLSLKTATGMESMKTDMGGAAAVLAALDAAAALGAGVRISALAPLTENMPGGSATKPGDVLTARNGKTIEVLNTDAEGRLVLADGLSLAVESEADAIVDLATLTGAAVVALGKDVAAVLGNDDSLLAEVRAAGDRAGESLWQLPLPDEYRSHIDSEVADMRNVGRPGQAGTIAAAMLLREFVGTVPWAHLDIAGPARSDDASGYLAKGGTGFGVRTLVALLTAETIGPLLAGLRSMRSGR